MRPIKITTTVHLSGKRVARRVTELQKLRRRPWYLK
jgi:hypothetical protein